MQNIVLIKSPLYRCSSYTKYFTGLLAHLVGWQIKVLFSDSQGELVCCLLQQMFGEGLFAKNGDISTELIF